MSTLRRFEARRHRPEVLQAQPVLADAAAARRVHESGTTPPTNAVPFFKQVGQSLKLNPLPTATNRAQRHPARARCRAGWCRRPVQRRSSATRRSDRSARSRASSRSASRRTGSASRAASGRDSASRSRQASRPGMTELTEKLSTAGAAKRTNYWSYLNADVGTYPNTHQGYIYRGIIVLEGGSANMPRGRRLRPDQQSRRHDRHPAQRQQHLQADVQAAAHRDRGPAGHRRACRRPSTTATAIRAGSGRSTSTDRHHGVGRPVPHPAERPEHGLLVRRTST